MKRASVDLAGLERALQGRGDGEVRFDAGSRGAYVTDGSNYRQVPLGVVVPRSVEAGAEAVSVCARFGAPVLSRGGGTSLGGQCTNTAVVIDWTKHCHRVLSVDADERTCVVEPGLVLDELNRQLARHRLKFGPKPSTHSHCSLGEVIGNNSCGASAQAYGKTADNVRRLEVLTYDGTRMWVDPATDVEYEEIIAAGGRRAELYRGLRELGGGCRRAMHLAEVLALGLDGPLPADHPEKLSTRPTAPPWASRLVTAVAVATACAATAIGVSALARRQPGHRH